MNNNLLANETLTLILNCYGRDLNFKNSIRYRNTTTEQAKKLVI